jgi:hypothetical protein
MILISTIQTLLSVVGIEYQEIPFHSNNDTLFNGLVLCCLLVFIYLISSSFTEILNLGRTLFSTKERINFDSSVAINRLSLPLLSLTYISFALFGVDYYEEAAPELLTRLGSGPLLLLFFTVCWIQHIVRYIFYHWFHSTFFQKDKSRLWLKSYYTLLYYTGLVVFLLVLATTYTQVSAFVTFQGILAVWIIILLLSFYRWISLFFDKFYGHLCLFVYFCTLEIGFMLITITAVNYLVEFLQQNT